MNWEQVKLGDICRPKQWKTLSKKDMAPEGFPVYGANGRIGFSKTFTHEKPVILVGCRGSCGSVHITEPKSYANGNAMALDDLDEQRVDIFFLEKYLRYRGFRDTISGTSQPQIIRANIVEVDVQLPSLPQQKRIAEILDVVEKLRIKRQYCLSELDALVQSTFQDMFGDPVVNEKGWQLCQISSLGEVITGNTPSRKKPEYYGSTIEWIKSDNINNPSFLLTRADEGLSDEGKNVARVAPKGSILVTCIAGSKSCIGNAAVADRDVAFNQQINAFVPNNKIELWYAFGLFLVGKRLIQRASTDSMKGMVSKSAFSAIEIPIPSRDLQSRFASIVEAIERQKARQHLHLAEIDALLASLQIRAFNGEL